MKLVTNEKALNKLVKKSNYKKVNIFHEKLVAIHMEKTTIKLYKPIYLGMSILDLSKTLMYKFHYEYSTLASFRTVNIISPITWLT